MYSTPKLLGLVEDLITERASRDNITTAIENRNIIRIYYAGDPVENEGWRNIEPYCFGRSTAGNNVIRAYQIDGATDTEVPGWKLFRIDRINRWNNTGNVFNEVRDKYDPYDDGMDRIYKCANFRDVYGL